MGSWGRVVRGCFGAFGTPEGSPGVALSESGGVWGWFGVFWKLLRMLGMCLGVLGGSGNRVLGGEGDSEVPEGVGGAVKYWGG